VDVSIGAVFILSWMSPRCQPLFIVLILVLVLVLREVLGHGGEGRQ
jgi:hypothetical protein